MTLNFFNFAGINRITKKEIEKLYDNDIKTALRIIAKLKQREKKYEERKNESDPLVINKLYVPGLVIPTIVQLNNFLNNNLKKKKLRVSSFSFPNVAQKEANIVQSFETASKEEETKGTDIGELLASHEAGIQRVVQDKDRRIKMLEQELDNAKSI